MEWIKTALRKAAQKIAHIWQTRGKLKAPAKGVFVEPKNKGINDRTFK